MAPPLAPPLTMTRIAGHALTRQRMSSSSAVSPMGKQGGVCLVELLSVMNKLSQNSGLHLGSNLILEISSCAGSGVFTTTDFERGAFLLEYQGDHITKEEGERRDEEYLSSHGSYLFFHGNEW